MSFVIITNNALFVKSIRRRSVQREARKVAEQQARKLHQEMSRFISNPRPCDPLLRFSVWATAVQVLHPPICNQGSTGSMISTFGSWWRAWCPSFFRQVTRNRICLQIMMKVSVKSGKSPPNLAKGFEVHQVLRIFHHTLSNNNHWTPN